MKDAEIEDLFAARIHDAVETAVDECIREFNSVGHDFQPDPAGILEWVDASHGKRLTVHCSLGVSVASDDEVRPSVDPM